jgi:hypothetical protein
MRRRMLKGWRAPLTLLGLTAVAVVGCIPWCCLMLADAFYDRQWPRNVEPFVGAAQ